MIIALEDMKYQQCRLVETMTCEILLSVHLLYSEEDRDKIRRLVDAFREIARDIYSSTERQSPLTSTNEECARAGIQNCHCCATYTCDDNTNPNKSSYDK